MPVPQNSTVRWFHSEMAGAPQIMAQAGDLIAILDACLINGFGTAAPDGDKITISNGVATVHFSGGHDFEKYAVVEISGATPAELNDVWRITGATPTAFTFDCPGIPDGIASGDIAVKRATPGYWEKAFGDTLKAAYRSTHPDATGFYLRVDHSSGGSSAQAVHGLEGMTDIDDLSQSFGSGYWRATAETSSSYLPRPWALIADDRWLYLAVAFSRSYSCTLWQFGDFVPLSGEDLFNCAITGHTSSPYYPYYASSQYAGDGSSSDGCYIARNADGSGSQIAYKRRAMGVSNPRYLGGNGPYPYPTTGGHMFSGPPLVIGGSSIRGTMPGLFTNECRNDVFGLPGVIADHYLVTDRTVEVPAMMNVKMSDPSNRDMTVGIDIEGPWR